MYSEVNVHQMFRLGKGKKVGRLSREGGVYTWSNTNQHHFTNFQNQYPQRRLSFIDRN